SRLDTQLDSMFNARHDRRRDDRVRPGGRGCRDLARRTPDRLAEALDEIEIDDGGAVDFQVAELEAIDLEEAELLDPAEERIRHLLDDEQNARRPGRGLRHRVET